MVPSPSPRILIVDDQRALLLSYRIIFQRAGYDVTTANTTADALSLLHQQQFDLLLCDLSIEQENSGLEIVDTAHGIAPDMAVVVMTGYSDETIPQAIIDRGTNVVFKPVEIPRLLETMDFLLRGKSRQRWRRRVVE